MIAKKKVLLVSEVVDRSRNYFTWRKKSINIICVFFDEVMKILLTGQEVRFPKNNGKLFLAVKHYSVADIKQLQFLKSKNLDNIFKGSVRSILQGFDVHTGGRVSLDKKFTLRFSRPRVAVTKLYNEFYSDIKRRKLPEIE